jgi:hypothetical protein
MKQEEKRIKRKFQWVKQMPVVEKPQIEKIIDQRVSKKTWRKTYFEYLIKWKGHPIEDASWEREIKYPETWTDDAGAHEQDSMNFSARGV